ncbi:VOC family protein [Nocardia aurantia]|uniref:VOC domain-containing protein n=1 Tax=Nocardia aurantia TaxID=2585199 RepID=A0A7K0DRL4_9NOCA|nr:VOC family protein [Nocardia aurantia]MQY28403.1 hypothetical protein [Nocardia aurantia]
MQILKTYARLFVADLDSALPLYTRLVGTPPDLRFAFEAAELAAIGDFLLIGGPPAAVDKYRTTAGPVIVDDLAATITELSEAGATLHAEPVAVPTGTVAYLRHPDGADVEYVQWTEEVRTRVLGPA